MYVPAQARKHDCSILTLLAQYYLGAIVGCFVGGWVADRIGRVNGLFYGAMFALVGGALQAATQSATFILVARVVTGLGTGGNVAYVPRNLFAG